MKKILVSLIFPVYNEDVRLVQGLQQAMTYLSKQRYIWEIIVVDDGSTKKCKISFGKQKNIHLVRLSTNQGKGAAIAAGVSVARGKYIFFSDIDISVPLSAITLMLKHLARMPIVIASRRTQGANIVVHQSWTRETAGRLFTFLSNALCHIDVSDATCGLKGFDKQTAQLLFSQLKIRRWVFDTELLFLARKYGIAIAEIGVSWSDRKGSKVRLLDPLFSLVDLLKIRWYWMMGEYR